MFVFHKNLNNNKRSVFNRFVFIRRNREYGASLPVVPNKQEESFSWNILGKARRIKKI